MKCEFCGKWMKEGHIAHRIEYGSVRGKAFVLEQDSAPTVICENCSMELYRIVYGQLENRTPSYPAMFRMHEELAAVMKNGYRFIQGMAKLPRAELVALQRVIAICKASR